MRVARVDKLKDVHSPGRQCSKQVELQLHVGEGPSIVLEEILSTERKFMSLLNTFYYIPRQMDGHL